MAGLRNSRPNSPAVYPYRQRTVDPKMSNPAVMSSRHSTLSLPSDRGTLSRSEHPLATASTSPTKDRVYSVQNYQDDVHSFEVSGPGPSQQTSKHATEAVDTTLEGSEAQHLQPHHSSHSLGRRTHSSKSLVSMQAIVAEESEDFAIVPSSPAFPRPAAPIQALPNDTAVLGEASRYDDLEEAVATSPEALRSSFQDSTAVPLARMSLSSLPQAPLAESPRTSKSSLHDSTGSAPHRTLESPLHEPLVAPTPHNPLDLIQPSLDQRLAESVERGIPVTSSPTPTAEVAVFQDPIPQAHSPLGSPSLSTFLHQQMGSPPPQLLQYSQPYPFTYPSPFMASPIFPPAFYSTQFTSSTEPFGQPGDIQRAGSASIEDERVRLLEKVSNVLPDLNRLLHYQESHGLLSKDKFVKAVESQHVEENARLRVELSACKEEYEKIIGQQASENLKLKRELAEQAENTTLTEDSPHALVNAKEELAALRLKCGTLTEEIEDGHSANRQSATQRKLLEAEIELLKDQLHDAGTKHERQQADLYQAHKLEIAARDEEHTRSHHEHKNSLQKIQLDLAGMITKHTQLKKDFDSARTTISELERSLIDKAQELEHTVRSNTVVLDDLRQDREEKKSQHQRVVVALSQELSHVVAKHEETQKLAEQQRLEIKRSNEREAKQQADLEKSQIQLDDLKRELEEERTARNNLKRELSIAQEAYESLKTAHEQIRKHHGELAEILLNLKNKQAEWQPETERMDRVLQIWGN